MSGDRYKVGGEGDLDKDEFDGENENGMECGDAQDINCAGEDKAGGVGVRATSA